MSNFKNIEKLGLKVFGMDVIKAEDLEALLQSAQVVYGRKYDQATVYSENEGIKDTHRALLLCIEPIKKKTKAEAALEFVNKMATMGSEEAEQILEMKD